MGNLKRQPSGGLSTLSFHNCGLAAHRLSLSLPSSTIGAAMIPSSELPLCSPVGFVNEAEVSITVQKYMPKLCQPVS